MTTLVAGAVITCTADAQHPITAADARTGTVTNTATATDTPPTGAPATSKASQVVTAIAATPALTVRKTGKATDVNGDGFTDAGDTIAWTITVRNTGNVPVRALVVTGPSAGTVTCPVNSTIGRATVHMSTPMPPVAQPVPPISIAGPGDGGGTIAYTGAGPVIPVALIALLAVLTGSALMFASRRRVRR